MRGDLLEALPALVAEVPDDATLVVFHSAVLAYLAPEDRARFVRLFFQPVLVLWALFGGGFLGRRRSADAGPPADPTA